MRGKKGPVPKILEERLLIDDVDRQVLKVAEELSPHNTGKLLVTPSIWEDYVPSLSNISEKVGLAEEVVQEMLNKISQIWGVPSPENLPTNSGFYTKEEAQTNALVNQHKLRWNPELNDYNVTKMHWISGEMGTGTLYTNNDAFLGEKIVRQAMGVDEKLVSYHMQGGIMPDIVTLFGKAKNKRAIMTGLNKKTQDIDETELETIVKKLNLLKMELGRPQLSEKSVNNMRKYVLGTIDSMEEAAESAGFELADNLKNIEPFSEVHLYWSYNDDYNQSEIEDKNIALLRDIHRKMQEASQKVPELEEKLMGLKEEHVRQEIDFELTNRFYDFLTEKRQKSTEKGFEESGKGFKNYTKEFFETKSGKRKHNLNVQLRNKLKKKAKEDLGREYKTFDATFEDSWNRFYDIMTTMKRVGNQRERVNKIIEKTEKDLSKTQKELQRLKAFESSHLVEELEGHSWFTKKIAITPTEAKSLETIKKEVYQSLYKDILIPSMKKSSGREDLQIYLHTDDIISVEVADPQYAIEGRKDDPKRPIGTIFTSIPRTNSQWSNEPLRNSFAQLLRIHEGEISKSIANNKKRPKTKGEFDKRDFAHTDFMFTGWGADGYLSQYKFLIDPTTVQGEYAKDAKIVGYIKTPTRHDLSKLGELMTKGNKGTWAGKRLAKGGTISGSVLLIEHADGTPEEIFFDDAYFKEIANKEFQNEDGTKTTLGERYNELEKKLTNAKSKNSIEKLEKEKSEILKYAQPHIGRLLLQNDLHVGSYSTPGRPSNPDTITSSQLAAIQTYGVTGFQMSLMSEVPHGELGFRSYDSKRETATNDDITHLTDSTNLMRRVKTLEKTMRRKGASLGEIIETTQFYIQEYEEGKPAFLPEDQLNMVDNLVVPANIDLMENGVPLFVGTGNHWMGKRENQSESTVMMGRFEKKYQEQQLLLTGQGTAGQSFSFDYIKVPSLDGKGIDLAFSHKFWHGSTEIDQIPNQLVRARSPATYAVGADRHHPGAIAQQGKMAVLDMGKQLTIPYAKMIGKPASLNGTMTMGYGMEGELILSSRYFANPVIDKISGWNYKSGVLQKARSLIVEAMKDDSLQREMRKISWAAEKFSKKIKI
ncbi:MAG: hypothetical protein KC516_04545 [Nanoarchaeota archaeon]|nr:hypothetical protein [Nanoarchaeota archaeon]